MSLEDLVSTNMDPSTLFNDDNNIFENCLERRVENAWSSFLLKDYTLTAELCQILIDESWEKMNTGHWKDVNLSWRYLYSYASLLKAFSLYYLGCIEFAIKTCDMGLLMGAPIFDNILAKIVSKLSAKVSPENGNFYKNEESHFRSIEPKPKKIKSEYKYPVIDKTHKIKRLPCPSLISFEQGYMKAELPVIVEKAISHWPAMHSHRWCLNYLRSVAGSRTVPIEIGSKYTSKEWKQKLLTVNEFIDKYIILGDEIGYLAQHQLFDQIPELKDDIYVPDYCCLTKNENMDTMINAWFGPSGTISPLHHDPYHNLFAQVVGEKYIRLYDRYMSEYVYAHENSLLDNTSQVDVENWDKEKFPKFGDAPYYECILKEGELLYIPPKWWHYIRSLSVSFSVSFWWK